MPLIDIGGTRLSYADTGSGPAVLLLAGTAARGRTWHLHQVPALVAAGFRVVTYDTRGVAPSDVPPSITMTDLVADAAGLIRELGLGPCRVAGSSMGARTAAELCLRHPDLVDRMVLMATFARSHPFLEAMTAAEKAIQADGRPLPPEHLAVVRAAQNLSPRTLADDRSARDWLDIFQLAPAEGPDAPVSRLDVDIRADRRDAYARIVRPCLVLGFADDLIAPARLGREVAAAIPGARYAEIPDAGHYGYLEQPHLVNAELLTFLQDKEPA